MYAIRRPTQTRYKTARAILRSGMIQVVQDRAPGKLKGGMYALLMKNGMVWFSETTNFNQMMISTRKCNNVPECIQKARSLKEPIDIYLLTKPESFCGHRIRKQLERADLLADRKTRDDNKSGRLFIIRHHTTHDYFIVKDSTDNIESTVLGNFITRLKRIKPGSRNKSLDQFIIDQTEDILNSRNFTIIELDKYSDSEDAWLKRQVYIDECKFGNNLNWNSVD